MARNTIPAAVSSLLSSAGAAADGAQLHQATIGLQHNTESRIRADRLALLGASVAYDAAKSARAQRATMRGEESEKTRRLITQIVDALRSRLGREWNPAWEAAGFTAHTLVIPNPQSERLGLLSRLESYFRKNPDKEIVQMGASAEMCAFQHGTFAAACAAADQADAEAAAAREARDQAAAVLQRRLRRLIDELRQLIGDEDPRWHAFGFNAPADPETPAAPAPAPAPASVKAGAAGSQTLPINWNRAARAERYRLMVRKPGQQRPLFSDTFEDEQAMVNLAGLGSNGAAVEVLLSGVNEAGSSPFPATSQATVP